MHRAPFAPEDWVALHTELQLKGGPISLFGLRTPIDPWAPHLELARWDAHANEQSWGILPQPTQLSLACP
jgi:hypothetical protein